MTESFSFGAAAVSGLIQNILIFFYFTCFLIYLTLISVFVCDFSHAFAVLWCYHVVAYFADLVWAVFIWFCRIFVGLLGERRMRRLAFVVH